VIRIPVRPRRPAPDAPYDIRIGRGLAPRLSVDLRRRRLGSRYVIVSDSHLQRQGERLQAAFRRRGLAADLVSFPAGEASKSRRVRDEIEDGIIRLGAGRDTVLVALGGGVVGDLTGFVAATFTRGIPYVQVPTTLIGMVDSAIGGKTGINHPAGKNLIGAFHQPAAVYIDVDYLKTLPDRHFNSGMAEVIKCGVIADRGLFAFLEESPARVQRRETEMMARIIEACCRVKVRVVEADPRESSRRKILNFGHTIGHAIETVTGFRLTHGEAVAIGMAAEARIAARLGLLAPAAALRIAALPPRLGLPVTLPPSLDPRTLLEVARRDKKTRAGRIACALPGRIGAMAHRHGEYGIPVDDGLILEVLQEIRRPAGRARPFVGPAIP
jgi:3-dehydroquinate synthase